MLRFLLFLAGDDCSVDQEESLHSGLRRDAAIVIGSLLLYALGPGLTRNPFHSREEVRHNGLVVHPGVALHKREGPHRLPLLPVLRGQGHACCVCYRQ